jgi:hypothetical protein
MKSDWSHQEPVTIAERVGSFNQYGIFSASTTGTLIWRSADSGYSRLTWIDRSGRELSAVGEPGDYPTLDLSKDGTMVVVSKHHLDRQNLWVMDLRRGPVTRLTMDEAQHVDPRWSPDGRRVIFGSTRDPSRSPFQVTLPDSRQEQVFKFAGRMFSLDDWSLDGSHLCTTTPTIPNCGLFRYLRAKPVLVTRLLADSSTRRNFSDGRWIAYNERVRRHEVKVSFQARKMDDLKAEAGSRPGDDGRELYFLHLTAC